MVARWDADRLRLHRARRALARLHGRVAARRLDSLTRVTEDRDSGLPRYYYSVYDHYLSPAWSPDGRELIFVSNRGRMYGTGGIWRMDARGGRAARETPLRGDDVESATRLGTRRATRGVQRLPRPTVASALAPRRPTVATRFSSHMESSTRPPRAGLRDGRRIAYISNEDGQHVALGGRDAWRAAARASKRGRGGTVSR